MTIRTKVGISHLDVARIGVEMFYKFRQKLSDGRGDRYILMTSDEPPNDIKSAWKENYSTFVSELRNLKTSAGTSLSKSINRALDLLNVNRAKTGVDNYSMGRYPFCLEPAVIICITDGTCADLSGPKINLSSNNKILGSELTIEPYRWDQRIFIFVLNFPAFQTPLTNDGIGCGPQSAVQFCEMTGGRALRVSSQKAFHQSLELLAQRLLVGVNIHFEAHTLGSESFEGGMPAWASLINFVNVPRIQNKIVEGNWPIPESFWVDSGLLTLPPRSAHPTLKFSLVETHLPTLCEQIPVDTYELESSPLTRYLLQFQRADKCWPVAVSCSGTNRKNLPPCGFLRTNAAMTTVFLVITPFNYPEFFPLIENLLSDRSFGRGKTGDLISYLNKIPFYYVPCFRRIMSRLNIALPDNLESGCISHSLVNSLRRIKSWAKSQFDSTANLVENRRRQEKKNIRKLCTSKSNDSLHGFIDIYRIGAGKLIEEYPRLRSNLLAVLSGKSGLIETESKHHMAISQMGNYQAFLRNIKFQPLREVDPQPLRLHPFGNPFKLNSNIMFDEANESMIGVLGEMKQVRRRSGPLPSNFRISVPYRSSSSASSTVSMDVESVAEIESLDNREPVKKPVKKTWTPNPDFLERVEGYLERVRLSIGPYSDVGDTIAVVAEMCGKSRDETYFLLLYAREIGSEKNNVELCECIDGLVTSL